MGQNEGNLHQMWGFVYIYVTSCPLAQDDMSFTPETDLPCPSTYSKYYRFLFIWDGLLEMVSSLVVLGANRISLYRIIH